MRSSMLLAFAALLATPSSAAQEPPGAREQDVAQIEALTLDGVEPLHRVGNVLLAGQPSAAALGILAQRGATVVIDLRRPAEQRGFDEPFLAKELGLEYSALGFGGPVPLSDDIFHEARRLLRRHEESGKGELLLHCASSNRVGAIWLSARVLDMGVPWEAALEEAHRVGLRSSALETAARRYVLGAGNQEFGKLKEEIRAKLPGVRGISVERLARTLRGDGRPPLLIDARAPEEYAVSHLAGAQRAQTVAEALGLLAGQGAEREVVVYCSVGYRSAYLVRDLAREGFSNVHNLEGSIFEWANTGQPLFRDSEVLRGAERAHKVHPYDDKWGRFLRRDLRAKVGQEK